MRYSFLKFVVILITTELSKTPDTSHETISHTEAVIQPANYI